MQTQLWLHSDLDLDTALQNQELTELIEYVEENQRHIASQWIQENLPRLRKILRLGTAILSRLEHRIKGDSKQYAIFRLGALSGTLESFNYLMYENDRKQQTVDSYAKDIKCIKHLKDVILLLDLYGDLTHSEISEKLHLNAPTLTEIMKKIIPTDLVRITVAGKYKLYSLTDIGRRLAVHLRGNKSESNQLDAIFEQLKDYMQHTNEKDRVRKHIASLMTQLDGAPIFPGDELSVDYQDERHNYNHVELTVQRINDNSDQHTSVAGTLHKRISMLPIDELLKTERRNENESNRTVKSPVRNVIG